MRTSRESPSPPVKGLAVQQRRGSRSRAERRGREPQAAPRRRRRSHGQREDVDAALARREPARPRRGDACARVPRGRRRRRQRSSSANRFETVFFGRPAPGASSPGPGAPRSRRGRASTSGSSCRTRSVRGVIAGSKQASASSRQHRSPISRAWAASTRSTPGASACSSRSTASTPTPRTPGSAVEVRIGGAVVQATRQRRALRRHDTRSRHGEHGLRHPRRSGDLPPRRREHRAARAGRRGPGREPRRRPRRRSGDAALTPQAAGTSRLGGAERPLCARTSSTSEWAPKPAWLACSP